MACVAIGCKSRMGVTTDNMQKKISFHRFPKEGKLRKKWIQILNRKNWTPSRYSRLCSLHFDDLCYREDYQKTTLHSDAVPTKFTNARTHLLKKEKPNHQNLSRSELGFPSTLKKDFLKKITELEDTIFEKNKTIKKLQNIAQRYKKIAEERDLKFKKIKERYIRKTKKLQYSETIINDLETKLRVDAAKIDILCKMIEKDD